MSDDNFIIKPETLSHSKAMEDLEQFLTTTGDANSWSGFFSTSTGTAVINAVAALHAMTSYRSIIARREGFLAYANAYSSVVAAAQTLGYSASKGRNTVLDLTVVPNFTGILERYSVIGSVKDVDLVLLDDTPVTEGNQVVLRVSCGQLLSETRTVTSTSSATYRFKSASVSEDYRVLLNGAEVTVSDKMKDLASDYFVAITNPAGAVDVMYLNSSTSPVSWATGDSLTVEYLKLKDISFEFADLSFDHGELLSSDTVFSFQGKEDIEEIRINAPTAHETQNLIRGREDYAKLFRTLSAKLSDTNQRDVTAAVIELAYCTDDTVLLTDSEKQILLDDLETFRPFGVAPPDLLEPTRAPIALAFTIKLLNSSGDPVTYIDQVLESFQNKLEQEINFETLENLVEQADFIKTARIEVNADTWQSLGQYERANHVKPSIEDGFVYEMESIIYKSGTVEPDWSSLSAGDKITDGRVVWTAQVTDLTALATTWQSETRYYLNDLILPTFPIGLMFKCTSFINKSFGNNEVQEISFSEVPDAGTFRIHQGDYQTQDIDFDATSQEIEDALNAMESLSEVQVTGDTSSTITILFQGADGNKSQQLLEVTDIGKDEKQLISFSDIPTDGTWALSLDGNATPLLSASSTAADVKNSLELLPNIDQVSVVGDFANGFTVTFEGINSKKDVSLLGLSDTTAGVDEVQTISFSDVPVSGSWRIHINDEYTTTLPYDADSLAVQTALNSLDSLSNVQVSGDYSSDFVVTFTGNDGDKPQSLLSTIHSGQNEIQKLNFSSPPDAGTFRMTHEGSDTIDLPSNASYAQIKSALESLASITEVQVSGDYINGIDIEFTGPDGNKPHSLITVSREPANAVQEITFTPTVPHGATGANESFVLEFDGELTNPIFLDSLSFLQDIEDELNSLTSIGQVSVTGDASVASTIQVEFVGPDSYKEILTAITVDTQPATVSVLSTSIVSIGYPVTVNNLSRLGVDVVVTTTRTVEGLTDANLTGESITITENNYRCLPYN